jgi:hypothetical protein
MDKTSEILQHDSIAETEKKLNKNWQEFNGFENFGMFGNFIRDNQIKENHLKSIGDTYFNMSWSEFKNKLESYGFILGLKYDIVHEDNVDEVIIYYHKEKGLIIYADSYFNKKNINSGHLCGEIQANSKEDCNVIHNWMSTGGCINKDNLIFETEQDVREGLFHKLSMLESAGKFLPIWTNKNRFLWLVDYVENKVENYNYKKISHDKIMKCPKELQEIVGINVQKKD